MSPSEIAVRFGPPAIDKAASHALDQRRIVVRLRDGETILLWHRGLSITDIALGAALLEKAKAMGVGQTLRFA